MLLSDDASGAQRLEARDVSHVRVVAIPASHPYVRHIDAADGIEILADPPVPGAPAGVWWPPVALDPTWIRANAGSADLLHVHFGTESFPAGHLSACIDAAHEVGWPVVFTAHDLEHPQLADQRAYRAQLGELMAGADAVLTLTPGAADDIRDQWKRTATVIRHPSILEPTTTIPVGTPSELVRIGVHLKDLRPNVDAVGTVRAMLRAAGGLRAQGVPAVVEIRIHRSVREPEVRDAVRDLIATSPHTIFIEHDRLEDSALAITLSELDVCVLPYRHGSHSGWLELCWDLAVPVVAPANGYFAQQHPDGTVAVFDREVMGTSLEVAIAGLLHGRAATRSGTPERAAQMASRRALRTIGDAQAADAHAVVYRRLLAERRP